MQAPNSEMTLGIISDTHGKLHPKIFDVFRHKDFILHAGDIGNEDVLTSLQAIAPTIAVWGNTDDFALRRHLKHREELSINGFHIEMTHIPATLDSLQFATDGQWEIKIFGHLHRASVTKRGNLLIINPGSASQPRDNPKPTVALLHLSPGREPKVEIIEL